MTTTVDLEALAASSAPGVTLLGNTVVESAGTGDSFADFSTLQRIYVQVEARLRSALYGAASLTVLIEQSSNGTDWTTAATFTFGPDGKQGATITGPITYLRTRWTVGNRSEWALVFVKAFPGIFDESGGSGGGGGGAVSSVFGRTGAVAATTGDYTASQVGALASTATLDTIAGANATAGDVSLNSHKLTNVTLGSASTDAATLSNSLSAFAPPTANLPIGSHKLTGVAAATASTDAATLSNRLDQFAAPTANVSMGTHKVTNAADGTDAADLATVGQLPTDIARAVLGTVSGVTVQPGSMPPTIGPELWVTANMHTTIGQHASTTPSITANSTAQTVRTLIALGNISGADEFFRVALTVGAMPANGWAGISMQVVNSGGTVVTNSNKQRIVTNALPWTGAWQCDIRMHPTWAAAAGSSYLEIVLEVANNATSGTLSLSACSVKRVAVAQRPMGFAYPGGGTNPSIFHWLFDPTTQSWSSHLLRTQIVPTAGAPIDYLQNIDTYNTDSPFQQNYADPEFLRATKAITDAVGSTATTSLATGQSARSLRVGNNDQILEVLKQDGTTWELRANTHGGESLIDTTSANLLMQYDDGSGSWTAWDGTGTQMRQVARRFQFMFNTNIARSSPDSDTFASTTHLATWFPDGMMRMDRTTTFSKDMRVRTQLDWMTSHNTSQPMYGRIGTGLLVLGNVDTFSLVAVPAAPTVTPAASGGSLADATYAYTVTALSNGGETTAPVYVTGAVSGGGGAGKNTVSWSAVTGATGYRVYGRVNSVGLQGLIATVGPTTTSYVDDGTVAQQPVPPPRKNTARRLDVTTEAVDCATSDRASWAVWYDPVHNVCFGNVYDRDAVLARSGVTGIDTKLEGQSGILKNYQIVRWTSDGFGDALVANTTQEVSRLIASGTVWTVTHWSFLYIPVDPVNFHLEIAYRALNLTGLKAAYPSS